MDAGKFLLVIFVWVNFLGCCSTQLSSCNLPENEVHVLNLTLQQKTTGKGKDNQTSQKKDLSSKPRICIKMCNANSNDLHFSNFFCKNTKDYHNVSGNYSFTLTKSVNLSVLQIRNTWFLLSTYFKKGNSPLYWVALSQSAFQVGQDDCDDATNSTNWPPDCGEFL